MPQHHPLGEEAEGRLRQHQVLHVAVALAGAQHDEHMQNALRTRDVIGQAKGILMAQQDVSADEAFDILRRASQRMNIKLRELAERVASLTPPDKQGAA